MPKNNKVQKHDIVVTRIIDAPVEEVWKAWTEPERVKTWWGPLGYTSPECKIDLREGGRFVFSMRAPKEIGGPDSYAAGTYRKIQPIKLLEFIQGLSDKEGNRVNPTIVGMPADFPQEIRTTVSFKRFRRDMTELSVTEFDWPVGQMFVYSIAGLNQSIDKLARTIQKH